ncbi:type II toxin-antitoxin system RelE/ParE family toxin [Hydrogenophaga sp.]|uniref:type II toxin-antitoxin system RelE/ParE family toxin n=1 Tax=Hydrogenophaga sp. TaxID=1904254 RepID=UPI003AF71489
MTRWLLAEEAVADLNRLTDFLLQTAPEAAVGTVDLVLDALQILASHPLVGRPLPGNLRELVISRGRTGYLALYSFDASADTVLVLALRHQRESDYH